MDDFTPRDEHLFEIQRSIDEHGYHIVSVLPDRYGPGFAYTVGWSLRGEPELMTIGAEPRQILSMFWFMAHLRAQGVSVTAESESVFETETGLFCVQPVPEEHFDGPGTSLLAIPSYLDAVGRLDLLSLGVLQTVWADARSRFPWDPGVDKWLALRQPILASGASIDWAERPLVADPHPDCPECRRASASAAPPAPG